MSTSNSVDEKIASSSEGSQSPIPDLSEELDLLPDDLDDFDADADNVEQGYVDEEEYEEEDEEDQLKRIFEEFDPGTLFF